jgi:hypothetical protein
MWLDRWFITDENGRGREWGERLQNGGEIGMEGGGRVQNEVKYRMMGG